MNTQTYYSAGLEQCVKNVLHATDNGFMVIDFHRYLNRFKKPER